MCIIVQKLKVPHIYFSDIDTQELPVVAKHITLVSKTWITAVGQHFWHDFMFMKVHVRTKIGENLLFNDGNKEKKWKNISTCISDYPFIYLIQSHR